MFYQEEVSIRISNTSLSDLLHLLHMFEGVCSHVITHKALYIEEKPVPCNQCDSWFTRRRFYLDLKYKVGRLAVPTTEGWRHLISSNKTLEHCISRWMRWVTGTRGLKSVALSNTWCFWDIHSYIMYNRPQ